MWHSCRSRAGHQAVTAGAEGTACLAPGVGRKPRLAASPYLRCAVTITGNDPGNGNGPKAIIIGDPGGDGPGPKARA